MIDTYSSITDDQWKRANHALFQHLAPNDYDIIIRVHNGRMHADDIFAASQLALICEDFNRSYKIVRSRDDCFAHIVLDTGNTYDPDGLYFDHHQRDFKEYWQFGASWQIPMASCGLVWTHFGHLLCKNSIAWSRMGSWLSQIDFFDNGRPEMLGRSQATSMAAMFGIFNNLDLYDEEPQLKSFLEAMEVAKRIIKNKIAAILAELPYEKIVMETLKDTKENHWPYGEGILKLSEPGNWKEAFVNNWKETEDVDLVVFPSGEQWMVQTASSDIDDPMSQRCSAPVSFRGLRDADLQKVCGVANATFVHKGGFLGGAGDEVGALALARAWRSLSRNPKQLRVNN